MDSWVPKSADLITTKRAFSAVVAGMECELVPLAWVVVLTAKLHAIAIRTNLSETWYSIFILHMSDRIFFAPHMRSRDFCLLQMRELESALSRDLWQFVKHLCSILQRFPIPRSLVPSSGLGWRPSSCWLADSRCSFVAWLDSPLQPEAEEVVAHAPSRLTDATATNVDSPLFCIRSYVSCWSFYLFPSR